MRNGQDCMRVFSFRNKTARDWLALLLYIVRSSTMGLEVSIMTFDDCRSVWSTVKLFPARSNAVMVNDTSPFVLFEYTFTLAFATAPFTLITCIITVYSQVC